MKFRVSAHEPDMSCSTYGSDPADKEISDDDDNDRNHKHRKRVDARSQSLEDDVMEQVFRKPYKKGSKPFPDGYFYGETGFKSNETWKKYRFNPMEKEFSAKFDQKRPGFTHYSRGPSDLNQKSRINQPFSGDLGGVRDIGIDFSLWSQRYPSLFTGRGLPTVSNPHGSSWSPFGTVPGVPNGDLNMLHHVGLQGTFRPVINSALNMGLARQRCRDFEEQGFCLSGDTCPMEHGVNRIVVEDVQSLSQFNLPILVSSANLSIVPVGTGPSTATSATTNTLLNSRTSHGINNKHRMGNNGLGANGYAADADFYDPDQPLWGNDSPTSTGPQSISQPNVGENDSLFDHRVGLSDGSDNELLRSLNPQSSDRGKITRKKRTEMGENMISKASTSNFTRNETMKSLVPLNSTQDPHHHQKMNNTDSSLKMQSVNGRMLRKPSQKAQRTLFVNGIPLQINRRETILSHFKKFGEVIDISIPLNSERAFVQFSKREEAEAALTASDAVMGNRYIKLWWAHRDKIQGDEAFSGHNMSVRPHGSTVSLLSPYNSVANKRIDDPQSVLHNDLTAHAPVFASDHPRHVVANCRQVRLPLQKKLEALKEELHKKQEMLDLKRKDFRRKLDKLEKQATGLKGEVAPEQVAKKQKVADSTVSATTGSKDPDTILPSSQDEVATISSTSVDPSGPQNAKITLSLALQESSNLRSSPRPLGHVGSPPVNNRFKLDNRPSAFKIVPPLPDGLVDVPVLKEHFSLYGDLSKVLLDDVECNAEPKTSTVSARIYFTTRHAAEKAFLSGKFWKGHSLQFVWLINSCKSRKYLINKETPSPSSKGNSDSSKTTYQKLSTSGDGESEKPQGKSDCSKTTSQKPSTSGDGESEKLTGNLDSSKTTSRKPSTFGDGESEEPKGNSDSSKSTSQQPSTFGDGESETPKGTNNIKDHTQPDDIYRSNGLSDE